MDEKLSEFRKWLFDGLESSETPDEAGVWYGVIDEFDERFGA